MQNKRIGVLLGGLNVQPEVSLETGHAVSEALHRRGHDVTRIFIDQDIDQVLRQSPIDVAFLALQGRCGEGGCIQGLLELVGIPYTGSSLLASALAMQKVKAKELFRLHNVPTPPYYVLHAEDLADIIEVHGAFGYPVVVKPAGEGSGLGSTIAKDSGELLRSAEAVVSFDEEVLVERYVRGQRVSVALLSDRVIGAIEIEPEAPYTRHLPVRLNPARYQGVKNLARRATQALGCSGVCRVDLIVTEGDNEYVLEVDTFPAMAPRSTVPKIAESVGMSYGELCEVILDGARLHSRPNVSGRRQGTRTSSERPSWSDHRPRLHA